MMPGRYLRIIIPVLGICLLAADARSQFVPRKRKESAKPAPLDIASPRPVFDGIEKAWRNAEASGIAGFIGDSRVYLDIVGGGQRGGFYSRSQVHYIFESLFKGNRQLKFQFFRYQDLDQPGRKVHGIAHWSYKDMRSGRLFQNKVFVTLKREGSSWVVEEIKTVR